MRNHAASMLACDFFVTVYDVIVVGARCAGSPTAELMRRTFGLDVTACPRCGGRLRLVALIEQAAVVRRILRHLGLPTEVPEPRPARASPRRLETLEDQSQDAPEFDAAW